MTNNQKANDGLEKNSVIPEETVKALRASFPRETHESRKIDDFVQTGVKPAYVIERLNEVFGMDCWDYTIDEERETDYEALVKVTMRIYYIDKNTFIKIPISSRTQWGSNAFDRNKKNVGDAKKGAITNAICKCASMFDVAHEAYKGLLPPVEIKIPVITDAEITEAEKPEDSGKKKPGRKPLLSSPAKEEATNEDYKKAKKELAEFFVEHNLGRNYLVKLMEDNFGKTESKDLSLDEIKALLAIVKSEHEQSRDD